MRLALRCAVILAALAAALAGAGLVAVIVTREGGCDRAPPDDDEPVPACRPGDKCEQVDVDPAAPTVKP